MTQYPRIMEIWLITTIGMQISAAYADTPDAQNDLTGIGYRIGAGIHHEAAWLTKYDDIHNDRNKVNQSIRE